MAVDAPPVLNAGYLGVDVFFILSGYVLALTYADRIGGAGWSWPSYRRFIAARLARIYPLHIAMLLAVAAVVLLWPGFTAPYPEAGRRFGPVAFFASVLLLQNWGYVMPGCWNDPAWSLSAEWAAYLAFPVILAATLYTRSRASSLLVAAALLAVYVAAMLAKRASLDATGTPGMFRLAVEFTVGCLLFRAVRLGLPPLGWPVDAAALLLLVAALVQPALSGLALPAFAVIVLLSGQNRGPVAHVLSWPPILFLGEVSYSIYLVHWLLIQLLQTVLPGMHSPPWLAAILVATVAVATATNRLIERPARTLGRRLAQ